MDMRNHTFRNFSSPGLISLEQLKAGGKYYPPFLSSQPAWKWVRPCAHPLSQSAETEPRNGEQVGSLRICWGRPLCRTGWCKYRCPSVCPLDTLDRPQRLPHSWTHDMSCFMCTCRFWYAWFPTCPLPYWASARWRKTVKYVWNGWAKITMCVTPKHQGCHARETEEVKLRCLNI